MSQSAERDYTDNGRIAAIDCGTNTIKLMIGALPEVDVRTSRMVRLGEGVDTTGRLSDAALERAFTVIDEYAGLLRVYGVPPERVRFCATSASRDAENSDVFVAGVQSRMGVTPEVIPGEEEAQLAYSGALRGLSLPADGITLVIDTGGGSTEFVLGNADGPFAWYSADMGSVRMSERHLHSDPATGDEIAACVRDVDALLDAVEAAGVDIASAATVVGIAGTFTTIAAGVLSLPAYDPSALEHVTVPVDVTRAVCARLVEMTTAQRLALGFMHPGRADVIDAGAIVVDRVLARVSPTTWTVSEADILEGIAWSVVRRSR